MTIPDQVPDIRATVDTKRWGELNCTCTLDVAGNLRFIPDDAVTLDEWRKDNSLVPPWLVESDAVRPTWTMWMRFNEDGPTYPLDCGVGS